jgi:hypothetical protein
VCPDTPGVPLVEATTDPAGNDRIPNGDVREPGAALPV